MTVFSSQLFELLKSHVLVNSRLTGIEASDCKILSAQISDKTSQTVSETTLKRIYGFAFSKFKPSLFTIDVLSNYCGYNGWEDFCKKQDEQSLKANHKNTGWDSLGHKAEKITHFTLQALKNKAGIPFNQSIKRGFIDDHLDEFINGDYAATILTAPPAYGKTMALCHWIDEKMDQNITSVNKDIILFFSTNALMNVLISGKDFNDWLLALLGYTLEDEMISLLDKNESKEGNFYLIIDGLDEHMFKINLFQLLLDQLMDIFSFYQPYNWFKIILTMRSANWINNRHILDHENPKWFNGKITDGHLHSNVPLFNLQEIRDLCLKINPELQTHLPADVAGSFNHPLYFQFYYKQHKDNFSFNHIDHTSIYELILNFILNKIYLGHHAHEKISLLKGLIENMDFKKREYDIDKLKVNNLFYQYSQAYKELMGIGFLKETNISSDLYFKTSVQFGNSNFLELAIANKLLYDNNNLFNASLISSINHLLFNNDLKLPVIKWCVMHAVKNGQFENLYLLPKTELNLKERSELIIFLGDLLNKNNPQQSNTGPIPGYFKQDCNDVLFNYFMGIEFINADYKKTMQTLLRFELSNYKKIITYTTLAITAALQLDMAALEGYLTKLGGFPSVEYQQFIISPLNCIATIYYFFKYGVIKTEVFTYITRFYFNPPRQTRDADHSQANDLMYLLAGYTLVICQKPLKMLRYLHVIDKINVKNAPEITGYGFFLKILTANSYFSLGKTKEFKAVHDQLAEQFKIKENSFTPYMKLAFYSLKIKKAILNKEYSSIPGYLKYLNQAADRSGNKFSKIFTINLLVNDPNVLNQDEVFYKQLAYHNAKARRECGLSPEVFSKQDLTC